MICKVPKSVKLTISMVVLLCVLVTETADRFERITDTYQAVSQLPQPNRDTMAYLILHLQRLVSVLRVLDL